MKKYETPYLYEESLLNLDIMAASGEDEEQFSQEDATLNVHQSIFGLES